VLPGVPPHIGFGGALDFEGGESFALLSGPPTEVLAIQVEAKLAFGPIQLKAKVPGTPESLHGPADDVEHLGGLLRHADDQEW
jgi:hypothetical protein